MRIDQFPEELRSVILPTCRSGPVYRCLGCENSFGIEKLLYTCPQCGQVLLIQDDDFDRLKQTTGEQWRRIFDYRKMLSLPAMKGIYRFHEFIGPVIPLDAVLWLGEGNTPVIEANPPLQERVGMRFFFKNDGQNPSASFKDRGMASALSYINHLIRSGQTKDVLAVCASTGDTSAAAALYAAYLQPAVKSAVLLPHGKVTPQQLSQPLGNGATVIEIPGVFDDCMKVVERLSEHYNVALLNSKNAWRILGQESYSYEIAQDFEYDLENAVVVLPIGNAGNISAVMNGFLKFFRAGILTHLPKIIGVQSVQANPVYRYYREEQTEKRRFTPVAARPSVAQAAMIGNPVSMPRVIRLVERYNQAAGCQRVFFTEVAENDIMDWQLTANRNGHIVCTHGGESLAGLLQAIDRGYVTADEFAVLDSTAHALKFSGFQEMYFSGSFPEAYGIRPDPGLINRPVLAGSGTLAKVPTQEAPLTGDDFDTFVRTVADEIAALLNLQTHKESRP